MDQATYNANPAIMGLNEISNKLSSIDTSIFSENITADQVRKKFEYLKNCIEKTDINLISQHDLQQLQPVINNTLAQVNALTTNPVGHSANMDVQLNAGLKIFPYPRRIPFIKAEAQTIINAVRKTYETEIKESKKRLTDFDTTIIEKQKKLDDLQAKTDELRNLLDTLNAEFQSQKDLWSEQIDSTISQKDAEATAKISEFVEKQAEANAAAKTDLNNTIQQLITSGTKLEKEQKDKLTETENKLHDWASRTEEKGNEILKNTREIYEKTGSTALSMDFISSAATEHKWYQITVAVATVLFLAGPISLAILLYYSGIEISNFEEIFKKLLLAVVFLIPAWFVNSIAQKHRRAEIAFRSLGLRIAAIEPYLALFPEAERNEVKKQLSEAFFTAPISHERNRNSKAESLDKQVDAIIEPVSKLIDLVKKRGIGD